MYGGDISSIELKKVQNTEKGFITTIDGAKADYQAYMKDKTRYDLIKQTLEDLTLDADKAARIGGTSRIAPIDSTASLLKRASKNILPGTDKFIYYFERVSSKATSLEDDLADSLIKIANYKLFSKANKVNSYKYELKISDLEARIEPLRLIIQQLKEINDFIIATKAAQEGTRIAKIQRRLQWLKIGNKDVYGLKNDAAIAGAALTEGGAGAAGQNFKTNLDTLQTQCNTKLTAFGGKLNTFSNITNILKDAQGYLNDKTITDAGKTTEIKKYYEMVWTIVSLGYYDKGDKGFNWGEYIQNKNVNDTGAGILKAIKQAMPTSLASNVDIKAKNFEKLYATMHLIYYGAETQIDSALTNYGATFNSITDINPIAADNDPINGMGANTIQSITSLTDKMFVLGLTNDHVGVLELNVDGTVKSSNLCPSTAAPETFANQKIAKLNNNTFVVGYTATGSFSVIKADTRVMAMPIKLTADQPILSIKCFTAPVGIDGASTDCICIHQTGQTGFIFYTAAGALLEFRVITGTDGLEKKLTNTCKFDISPDGTKIAVFESAAGAGAERLFLCDIDYTSKVITWQKSVVPFAYFGKPVAVAGATDYITSISYSPDGSTLAVGLNRPGEYTVACTAQGNDSTQLSLNVKIDTPKAATNIVVYNSGSKEELFRTSAPGGSANNVRFSPDGSLIAAIVNNAANYSKYYNLSGVISAAKTTLAGAGGAAADFTAAATVKVNTELGVPASQVAIDVAAATTPAIIDAIQAVVDADAAVAVAQTTINRGGLTIQEMERWQNELVRRQNVAATARTAAIDAIRGQIVDDAINVAATALAAAATAATLAFRTELAQMLNVNTSLKMIFNKRRGSEDAINAATFTGANPGEENIEHLANTPMFLQYMFQPADDALVTTVITTLIDAIGGYFVAEDTGNGIVGMKRLKSATSGGTVNANITFKNCADRGTDLIKNGEADFKVLYADLSANEAEWNSVEGRAGVKSRYSDSTITKINQLTWCYGGYIAVRLGEIGSRNVQLFDASDGFYNNSFLTENAAQMLTPAASANLIAFGNTDDSLQIISTNAAATPNQLHLRKWDVQYTQLLEAYNKLTATPVSAEVFSDFYNDFQTSLNYFTFQKDFFQNAPANGSPTGIEYIAMQTIIDDVVKSDPSYDVDSVTPGTKVEKVFEDQLTAYVGQLHTDNGDGRGAGDAYKGLNINRNPFKQLYTLNQYDNYNFMVSSQRRIVLNTKMLGPAVLKLDINNFPVVSNEVIQYVGEYYRDYVDYKMSIGKEKSFKYTPHGFGKILYLRNKENPEDLQDTSCKGFFRNGLLFGYADHAYGDISYENNTDAVAYIYRGYWKNDKRYGSGVVYSGKSPSTNKIKFIGNFVDDQRYGNGIEFSDDFEWKDPEKRTGTVYYGYWVNGQFGWANDIYSQRTNVTIYEYKGGRMESKYVGEIRQNEDGKILSQGKGVKTTYGYVSDELTNAGFKTVNKETVDAGTFFEGNLSGTDKDNTIRTVKDLDAGGATTKTVEQKGTFVKGQPVKVNVTDLANPTVTTKEVAQLDADGKPTGTTVAAHVLGSPEEKAFTAFETQKTKELDEDQADLQTFNNRDIDKLQGKSVPIIKTNSERRVEVEKQKATDKGRVSALDDKMKDREKILAVSQAVSQGKYVKIDNAKATAETDFGIIIFANKNKYIGPIIDNGNTLLISTIKGRLESEGGDVLIASDPEGKNESAWSKYVLSADMGKYKDPSKLPQQWVSYRPYDIFSIIPKNSAVSAVFAQQEVSNAIMNTSAAGKTFISDEKTLEKMRQIIYRDIVIYVQAYVLVIRSILGNNGPKTDANGDPVDSCGRPMQMGGGASQMGSDQLVDAGVGQYIDLNLLQQTGFSGGANGIEGTSLMGGDSLMGGSGIEGTSLIGGNVIQVGGGEVEDLEVAYQAYIRQLSVLTGAINSSITTIGNKPGFEPLKRTLESYASKYDTAIKRIEENISQIKEAQRKTDYVAGTSTVAGLQPLKYKFPNKTNTKTDIDDLTAALKLLIDAKNAIKLAGPSNKAEYNAFLNRTSIDASQLEMLKTTYISGAANDTTLDILDPDYYPIGNPALKRKELGTAAAGVRKDVADKLKLAYEELNTAIVTEMGNVDGEVGVVDVEIDKFNPPSANYDPKWLAPLNNVKSKLTDYKGKLNELKGKIESSITPVAIAAKPLSYSQLNEYYREYSNIFGTAFAQVDQAINDLYSTISPALSGGNPFNVGAKSVNTDVIKVLKKKNLDDILTKMTGQYGLITAALIDELGQVNTNGIDKVGAVGAINAGFAPVWRDDLTALQTLLTEYQAAFTKMNTDFTTKYPPDGTDYVSLVAFLKTNETTFGTYNNRRQAAIDKLKSDMMLIDPGTKARYTGKLDTLITKLNDDTTILKENIKPPAALPREIGKKLGDVTVSKPGESIVDISSIFKTIFNYLNNPKSGNKDTVVLAFEKYKKMIETDKSNKNLDEILFTELGNIDSTYADYFHAEIDYLEIKDDANVPSKEKQDKKAILDKFTTINTRTKSVLDQLAAVYVNIKKGKSDANVKITISDIAKTIAPIKEGEFETYLTDIDLSLTGPNSGYSRFLGEFPQQIKDLQSFPNQTSNFVKEILNAIIMSVSKNTGNLLDGNSQQLDKFDKNQVLLIINKNIIILFNMYLIIISKLPITDPFLVLNLYNGFGVAYEKTYDLIQRRNESDLAGFEKNKEEIFENSDTNDFIKSILMAIAVSVAAGGVAAAASGIFTASGGKKYTRRRKVVKRKYRTKRHRKLNLKGRKYVTRKVIKKRRKGKGKK
jgi:WD40 repeat protein